MVDFTHIAFQFQRDVSLVYVSQIKLIIMTVEQLHVNRYSSCCIMGLTGWFSVALVSLQQTHKLCHEIIMTLILTFNRRIGMQTYRPRVFDKHSLHVALFTLHYSLLPGRVGDKAS